MGYYFTVIHGDKTGCFLQMRYFGKQHMVSAAKLLVLLCLKTPGLSKEI